MFFCFFLHAFGPAIRLCPFLCLLKASTVACRFQLNVEVFDYLDAELRLADTGEKQNPPLSFLPLAFSMKGNLNFFLRFLPAASCVPAEKPGTVDGGHRLKLFSCLRL